MNIEIEEIIEQLKEVYEGDPWYGRSIVALLAEVSEQHAFIKLNEQHSIVEILWHMINWREFTIARIKRDEKEKQSFEPTDWMEISDSDKSIWLKGIYKLQQTQNDLIDLLRNCDDELLEKTVAGRPYFFRKLLFGIVQHDIYHIGQIAIVSKIVNRES